MNPFTYGGIVSGENYYNREDEARYIRDTLSGGNHLMLYAPRRFGKSSLVNKVLSEMENDGFTTLYFDMMSVFSLETLSEELSKAILRKGSTSFEKSIKKFTGWVKGLMPSLSFDASGNPEFSVSWHPHANTEESFTDILNLPEKLASGSKQWIIAFDEFQEITNYKGDHLEKLIRSQIQHHKNVSYLFLGSKKSLLQDMFTNKARAFYNIGGLMQLNPIEAEKSIEYLKNRFKKDGIFVDEEVATYLIEKASNVPYFIQYLAAEAWQLIINTPEKRLEQEHIDGAIRRILELRNDYYLEVFDRQTANRKKLLIALAQCREQVFSKKYLRKYDLFPASSAQKSLKVLIDQGVVEKYNNEILISDPLYRRFLVNLSKR